MNVHEIEGAIVTTITPREAGDFVVQEINRTNTTDASGNPLIRGIAVHPGYPAVGASLQFSVYVNLASQH